MSDVAVAPPREFFSPGEIAGHLHVSVSTVRRWVNDGALRAVNVRSTKNRPTYRVFRESYVAFLLDRGLTDEDVARLAR